MFEEICIVCGKHLNDDGRAYCSDNCQHSDLSSPSISSSSSALSSPNMPSTAGGDVPALLPSALGSALRVYAARSGPYVASSWSVLSDDDDEPTHRFRPFDDDDASTKSASLVYALPSSALSYARRPSGTNNHSTVPHLHRRPSSGSSSMQRGVSRSAPMGAYTGDDDDDSFSFDADSLSDKDWDATRRPKYPGPNKPKRTRPRGSLPAYFSLLQMPSATDARASPTSSSGQTIAARASPIPRYASTTSTIGPTDAVYAARGRRREVDWSSSSRRSRSRSSFSRSKSRRTDAPSPRAFDPAPAADFFEDDEIDWATAPLRTRGRDPVRRHSSPPPRSVGVHSTEAVMPRRTTTTGVVDDEVHVGGWRGRERSASRPQQERGRARIDAGACGDAPGYGNGRSGLVCRERERALHAVRVPL